MLNTILFSMKIIAVTLFYCLIARFIIYKLSDLLEPIYKKIVQYFSTKYRPK